MHKPYDGKAQFTDSLDAIEDIVNEGHTGTDIYRTLTEAEKITLSYKQFQRYLADYR